LELAEFKEFLKQLDDLPNVQPLSGEQLKQRARAAGHETPFGVRFMTDVRNRSARLTVCIGSDKVQTKNPNPDQKRIIRELPKTLELVKKYIEAGTPMFFITKRMGANSYYTPTCKLYVSTQRGSNIRLAYMLDILLFDPDPRYKSDTTLTMINIPEWQEKDRQILVFPEEGFTIVLGTDYFGEVKKGFLRMAMWLAKQRGWLGVHAGSKLVWAKSRVDGKLKLYGMLPFGLSGTGKTIHTCHDHGLNEEGEKTLIVQDDFVMLPLEKQGPILGTEQAFFLKTENLDEPAQAFLKEAMKHRNSAMENVFVSWDGRVDFSNHILTSNGRVVLPRDDLRPNVSDEINLPPIDELDKLILFIITRRNTVIPIAAKLTPEQGAAAFVLGESIETTAGDPRRAGESIRVLGTNPFIVGDEAEEGNLFYQFIKDYEDKVECYLVNTGRIGQLLAEDEEGRKIIVQEGRDITIEDTALITRAIFRGTVKWEKEPYFGYLVPVEVEGLDMSEFDPRRYYTNEQMENFVNTLKRERREYIERYSGLAEEVVRAINSD
jgi:phosphoenolpyruvate carboxykinase (ATP)